MTVAWRVELKPTMSGKICKGWVYLRDDLGQASWREAANVTAQ